MELELVDDSNDKISPVVSNIVDESDISRDSSVIVNKYGDVDTPIDVESTIAVVDSVVNKSLVDRMSAVSSVEVVSIVVETVPVAVTSDKLNDVITLFGDIVEVVDGKKVDSAFSLSPLSSEESGFVEVASFCN